MPLLVIPPFSVCILCVYVFDLGGYLKLFFRIHHLQSPTKDVLLVTAGCLWTSTMAHTVICLRNLKTLCTI